MVDIPTKQEWLNMPVWARRSFQRYYIMEMANQWLACYRFYSGTQWERDVRRRK